MLEDHMKYLEERAIDCFKKPNTGGLEAEGRKTTVLRTIEFGYDYYRQTSAKIKEYEV